MGDDDERSAQEAGTREPAHCPSYDQSHGLRGEGTHDAADPEGYQREEVGQFDGSHLVYSAEERLECERCQKVSAPVPSNVGVGVEFIRYGRDSLRGEVSPSKCHPATPSIHHPKDGGIHLSLFPFSKPPSEEETYSGDNCPVQGEEEDGDAEAEREGCQGELVDMLEAGLLVDVEGWRLTFRGTMPSFLFFSS